MDYLLVQNQSIVHLGPVTWKQRFIQSEINDLIDSGELNVDYTVTPVEQGYINIGDGFEFFPVSLEIPAYDSVYQHLAGPVWSYTANVATGTYTVIDRPINDIKSSLLTLAASERYRKECLGTTANVTSSNVTISLATDPANRGQYVVLLNSMTSNTINFKTSSGFIELSNTDIQIMVTAVNNYVQSQFNWEQEIHNQVNDSQDTSTLKSIQILPVPVAPVIPGA
jgi:hypothetical protein